MEPWNLIPVQEAWCSSHEYSMDLSCYTYIICLGAQPNGPTSQPTPDQPAVRALGGPKWAQ
jgi:hypothetical protein